MPDGPDLGELDWHSEVDDGVATLRLLQQQPWVDADQIYIVGLSLGGMAAPIVTRRVGGVAGIFSWAATARPWATYAIANLRHQLIWRGFPAETVARVAELCRYWNQQLIDTDEDAAQLLEQNPGLAEFDVTESGLLGRPTVFWRQLSRFDPVESYCGLRCRIGAVRGSVDFAAHPADLQAVVRAAEAAGLTVDSTTLHGLDHLLRRADSAAQACRHGGGHGEPAYDRLAAIVVAWMDGTPLDEVD